MINQSCSNKYVRVFLLRLPVDTSLKPRSVTHFKIAISRTKQHEKYVDKVMPWSITKSMIYMYLI